MRTRNISLYNIYRPGQQYSEREREHFDNAWNLQNEIPIQLVGNEFAHIDTIWVGYVRLSSGTFRLVYTIFYTNRSYRMLFQNITRLTDIEQSIIFLKNNLHK